MRILTVLLLSLCGVLAYGQVGSCINTHNGSYTLTGADMGCSVQSNVTAVYTLPKAGTPGFEVSKRVILANTGVATVLTINATAGVFYGFGFSGSTVLVGPGQSLLLRSDTPDWRIDSYDLASGGSVSAGVATFNGRTGTVLLIGADLPAPTTSVLGGVKSLTCLTGSHLGDIDTTGTPHCTADTGTGGSTPTGTGFRHVTSGTEDGTAYSILDADVPSTLTGKTVDGVTPTVFARLDPTSSVQTQLNGKAASNASTTVNGVPCTLSSTCTVADSTKVAHYFGTTAPGSVAGNLPGDDYTDTTGHNAYRCGAPSGTAAPACTTVSASSWILLNDGNSGGGGGGYAGASAKTANYTLVSGDTSKLISFTGTSLTASLPSANPGATWWAVIQNLDATDLTVSRNGLNLNNQAVDIALHTGQTIRIYSDGTGYLSDTAVTCGSGITCTYSKNGVTLTPDTAILASKSALQNGSLACLSASGSGTTYTALCGSTLAAYVTNQRLDWKADVISTTTTPTLNIDTLGAKTLVKQDGTALAVGDIKASTLYRIWYDGTNIRVVEAGIGGGSSSVWTPLSAGLGSAITLTGGDDLLWPAVTVPAIAAGACINIKAMTELAGGNNFEILVNGAVVSSPVIGFGATGGFEIDVLYCNNAGVQNAQTINYISSGYCTTCTSPGGYTTLNSDSLYGGTTAVNWALTTNTIGFAVKGGGTVHGRSYRIAQ